ncbi:hypothetical protein IAI10_16090 [Clostridium sp. 19966]|uniref:hypothetical protein n=1 Tax=Clostridium sp. 19966 TaxID=2768166 RepID=UPI0028DF0703|nr:hypothetical protein [Clostridium sp. 19966]MDT8718187.1 hypothetical protein [Clostridium sp. 19966]
MKKVAWIDGTSYGKGERGVIQPRVLKTKIENVSITVHKHIDYGNTWLLTCRDLNIEKEILQTENFEKAQEKAFSIIVNKIENLIKIRDFLLNE